MEKVVRIAYILAVLTVLGIATASATGILH